MLILTLLVVGLAAGVLAGLFGIGGGVVIVPALIFIARFTPVQATATSLGALLLPVGALGAWEFYRAGHLDIIAALCIALGLFLGAGLGARLAMSLSPDMLRRAFSVFLVLVAIRMWFK